MTITKAELLKVLENYNDEEPLYIYYHDTDECTCYIRSEQEIIDFANNEDEYKDCDDVDNFNDINSATEFLVKKDEEHHFADISSEGVEYQ